MYLIWRLIFSAKSPLASIKSVEEEKAEGTNVAVPNISEDIETFFQKDEVKSEELDVSVDDFNELFLNAGDMYV